MTNCLQNGMIVLRIRNKEGDTALSDCKNTDSNMVKNIFAMLTPVEDGREYPSDGELNMQELSLLKKIMDEMPGGFLHNIIESVYEVS